MVDFNDAEQRKAYRHTTAHIMAQAVKRLWPDTKCSIGPAIEDGFYYDFDKEGGFTAEDLKSIEAEMKKIVKEKLPLERFTMTRDEALAKMKEIDEPYKIEIINDLPEDAELSFYKQGEYLELCRGPHVENTGDIKAFKLLSVAGAYWRGDSSNKMLSRIYGTSFPTKEELKEYLDRQEEAKKRDHTLRS